MLTTLLRRSIHTPPYKSARCPVNSFYAARYRCFLLKFSCSFLLFYYDSVLVRHKIYYVLKLKKIIFTEFRNFLCVTINKFPINEQLPLSVQRIKKVPRFKKKTPSNSLFVNMIHIREFRVRF